MKNSLEPDVTFPPSPPLTYRCSAPGTEINPNLIAIQELYHEA